VKKQRTALFQDIDYLQIPVPDLETGLDFYRGAMGLSLIWRTPTAARLQMADSASEIVVQTERPELEANLSVTSTDAAAARLVEAGGTLIAPPFDIPIGLAEEGSSAKGAENRHPERSGAPRWYATLGMPHRDS
jgi:predicted enzyme related to lactoylglutathione lyase